MSLQIVNPMEWVQKNERQLFPQGRVDELGLVAYLTGDVVAIGRGDCRIAIRDEWVIVSSNSDWLQHSEWAVIDLFSRVVPAREHGPNSLRAEVLLNVFAKSVESGGRVGGRVLVKGTLMSNATLTSAVEESWSSRYVAFALR